MEVFIIEDDLLWRIKLEVTLKEIGLSVIGKSSSIEESRTFLEHHTPDIIVADVMLGNEEIFDLFADGRFVNIPILLVTQSVDPDNYQQARMLANSHFLVKPFHPLSLQAGLDILMKDHPKADPTPEQGFVVRGIYNERILLNPSQILWVKQERNYCYIKTSEEQFSMKMSLNNAAKHLGKYFIKVNRACLINKQLRISLHINKMDLMTDHEVFRIGRRFREGVLRHLTKQEKIGYASK